MTATSPGARPLRIGLVSADFPPVTKGAIGGIGGHMYTLSHALAGLGHDVSVIAQGPATASFDDGLVHVRCAPVASARQWKLGRWVPMQWLRWTAAAYRTLRSLQAERPLDLVVFPDAYGEGFRFSLSPFAAFAVLLGGPASFVQRWDGRPVPPSRARFESWLERTPAAKASLLLCASRQFADEVAREWSLDAARIAIVRNPLDLVRFSPADEPASQASPTVLFAGHLQRLKGLRELAAAVPRVVAQHPGVRFRLIGNDTRSGPQRTSMRAELETELARNGGREHVEFMAPVTQSQLVGVYRACTVFVLPSHRDVYPNAALEAMGCGRPCVVTSSTGVAELVRDSGCGIVVPPRDPDALAAALVALLALPPEQRAAMGARGRKMVEDACATPVIARQWESACRAAVAARARER